MEAAYQILVYTQLATWKALYAASRVAADRSPERIEPGSPPSILQELGTFLSPASCVVPKEGRRGALFVGSAKNAADWGFIRQHDISAVVNVTEEVPNFYEAELEYHGFEVRDDAESSLSLENLHSAADFIEERLAAGRSVLLHCFMGRSRSVAVACAHQLLHLEAPSLDYAYAAVRRGRACANMNTRFIDALTQIAEQQGNVESLTPSSSSSSSSLAVDEERSEA